MSNQVLYKDLVAFHPGSYVEEIIDSLNITQEEFANRLGSTSKTVSQLVNGETPLSKDLAHKLSKLTGISFGTWMNLQNEYDKDMFEIEEAKHTDEEQIVKSIDFGYFKKYGLVADRRYSSIEKIKELRRILNVANITYLESFNPAVSYRNPSKCFNSANVINSNIMLELASNKSRNKSKCPYNSKKLNESLDTIRSFVLKDPKIFYNELKELLGSCGIQLVALPHLKNANLNGATKRFKDGSVLLLISDLNKKSDIFWFSLMHEIGHILNNEFGYRADTTMSEEDYEEKERRADRFARNFLIPDARYKEFVNNKKFSEHDIREFAREVSTLPSIVVGRLQNDGYINYSNLNHLRKNYYVSLTS